MVICLPLAAQEGPRFEIDPHWPGPLPAGWINATLGHPCVDSHDHIAILDRQNITAEEAETSQPTPSILLFDTDGNLVNSWGDSSSVPDSIHGCAFDAENNIWVVGNNDGIAQKYDARWTTAASRSAAKRPVLDTSRWHSDPGGRQLDQP